MATNTNTKNNGTKSTGKVCASKLSALLTEWENVELHNASALASWVVIGSTILNDGERGLQAAFVARTGANKGDVSTAVTIAKAVALSAENGDDEFVWEEFSSLASAGRAARAYLKGEDAPEPKAPKAKGGKVSASDLVKSLGKAEAKRLAMQILDLV
jgi:hypothetical protein